MKNEGTWSASCIVLLFADTTREEDTWMPNSIFAA
jgi:hypothetical protein